MLFSKNSWTPTEQKLCIFVTSYVISCLNAQRFDQMFYKTLVTTLRWYALAFNVKITQMFWVWQSFCPQRFYNLTVPTQLNQSQEWLSSKIYTDRS